MSSCEAIGPSTWANQAPHGADQRGYGTDLAPTWAHLGSTDSDLGTNLGHLGCKQTMRNVINHCFPLKEFVAFYVFVGNVGLHAILGPTCSQLKLNWGNVGPTLSRLGPNLARLWSIVAPKIEPKWHPKATKKRARKKQEKNDKGAKKARTCAPLLPET